MRYRNQAVVAAVAATGAVIALCVVPAWAQGAQSFPTKPIRIVVPFTPGNALDLLARRIGPKMTEQWGQQVVIDNRGGAGGIIGTNVVARAEPDGYTLMMQSVGFALSAVLYPKLPYDSLRDFTGVGQIASGTSVLVVAPSLGVRSVKELIALAREKPGRITYGSAGVGSSGHFNGEQFRFAAGIETLHVPYKGVPEPLLDTMTGRIQYFLAPLAASLPMIRDGRLLALAVSTGQRTSVLPDVPTISEAAVPGYEYQAWFGVFAPAKTPRPVIDRINGEIRRILDLPDIRKQMAAQGEQPKPGTPEEFDRFVRAEIENAARVVKRAGIRIE